jgi:hypothetical protein
MPSDEIAIAHTRKWIADVVVGCNFCPFASRVLKAGNIHYVVVQEAEIQKALEQLALCFLHLDSNENTETLFLIFPGNYQNFEDYLDLLDLSQAFLKKQNYEGIYQIASFHPGYLFAGSTEDDPANYTNRSPYPMLHLLREESVTRAIDSFPAVEKIPEQNIDYARKKGLLYLQSLREACFVK